MRYIAVEIEWYMGRYCPSSITFHWDISNEKVNWWF